MSPNRNEARIRYLEVLDEKSNVDPWGYWEPTQLGTGLTEMQLIDAIRYLGDKGLIEAIPSMGDHGLAPARISAYGQDFLSNARAYTSDRDLGSLAQTAITIQHNTTNITGSAIGNLASGGTGHTFSGPVTINHPQAEALGKAFQDFKTKLAADTTLSKDEKREISENLKVIEEELAKSPTEQDEGTIKRRWDRVTGLIALAAPLMEISVTIGKLLFGAG